jgi:hypothetical protein
MAEKRKGTTARGAAKKAGNRKKAPTQGIQQKGAAKKATARKTAAPKGTGKKAGFEERTSPEERFRLIQEAAYFKAEKEGFNRDPSECWLVAEAEVDARLASSR